MGRLLTLCSGKELYILPRAAGNKTWHPQTAIGRNRVRRCPFLISTTGRSAASTRQAERLGGELDDVFADCQGRRRTGGRSV